MNVPRSLSPLLDRAELLAAVDGAGTEPPETVEVRSCYRRAAAVLATFDPDRLRPGGQAEPAPAATRWLLEHCEPMFGPDDAMGWALEDSLRQASLGEYVEWRDSSTPVVRHQELQKLRAPNQPAFDSPLQEHLDAWIEGHPFDLEGLSADRLTALLRVLTWLPPGVETVSRHAVEAKLDLRSVVEPMEELAEGFHGRERFLGLLRDHVGVLDPSTPVLGTARRWFRKIRGRAPLVVYGVGGVGKSTLVARFVLDHALLPEPRTFPFVYLDFDRPEFSAQQPITLLAEAARQVGSQYPQYRTGFLALRSRWLDQAARSSGRRGRLSGKDLEELAGLLGECAKDKPVLLVLDTFEEVQHRGDDRVRSAARFVDDLRQALDGISELRVVVAGRSELTRKQLKLFHAGGLDQRELEGFDSTAARAFAQARLEKLEVADGERLAAELVRYVPGNPLTLKLAAEVVKRSGLAAVEEASDRARIFLSVRNEVLQGYLYERILGNLHSAGARQLANPGLAVRRITPEVILEVLNGPCELGIETLEEAAELRDQLATEAALVRIAADGALEHRSDVRRATLPLVAGAQQDTVRAIHENAVRFYRQRGDDPRARAEEIYHLLMSEAAVADVEERWMDGVEPHLESTVEDFTGSRREYLESRIRPGALAFSVGDEELLDPVTWERETAAAVRDLLDSGQASEALERLRGGRFEPESSALRRLEAESLLLLGRLDEAEKTAALAVDRAAADANSRDLAAASWLQGRIALDRGDRAAAIERYRTALQAAGNVTDELSRVRIGAELLALERADGPSRGRRAEIWSRLAPAYGAVVTELATEHPATLRSLAADVGDLEVEVLRNALELIGLGRPSDEAMEELAQAMVSWDRTVSASAEGETGDLAVFAELADDPKTPLQERWLERLYQKGERLGPWLAGALADFGAHPPVVTVLRRVYELWGQDQRVDSSRELSRLDPAGRKLLREVILDAFDRNALKVLASDSFGTQLEEISMQGPLKVQVFELIQWAERTGRLDQLIKAVYRERPARWDLRWKLRNIARPEERPVSPILDQVSLDFRDDRVSKLQKLLSEAYPTTEEAMLAARRASLPRTSVSPGRSKADSWQSILTAAAERGELRNLVQHALEDEKTKGFHSAIRSVTGLGDS